MSIKTELFLIPMAAHGGIFRFLVRKDSMQNQHILPNVSLKTEVNQKAAIDFLLKDIFSNSNSLNLENWLSSKRCIDRIIDVYDRGLLFEKSSSISVVRGVAIPEDFAGDAKGTWISAQEAFSNESMVSDDCKFFIRQCTSLVPFWVKYSSFVFELLPPVFSIQDLRILVGMLSGQEIDAGNFHRRLKRLDILKPLVSGQRIHRWEFTWGDLTILRSEGLIP